MANIIDYLQWRGDIPVSQVPLGEVDALVLSYLSYMPFQEVMKQGFHAPEVRLGDAAAYFAAHGMQSTCMIPRPASGITDGQKPAFLPRMCAASTDGMSTRLIGTMSSGAGATAG